MSLVQFRHRTSKPTDPVKGSFYWVELEDKVEIWFSPDGIADNLVLLSNDVDESILSRISTAEDEITAIKEIIAGIDLSQYVKAEDIQGLIDLSDYAKKEDVPGLIDLSDYAKKEDIPDEIELTDSDYDIIAEKVNEKIVPPLRWEIYN